MSDATPAARAFDRQTAAGLALLLLVATLGEGGGSPTGLLIWHCCLVALVVWFVWRKKEQGGGLPLGPDGVALGWTLFLLLCLAGIALAPYAYAGILLALELAACTAAAVLALTAGPDLLRRIVLPLAAAAALQGGFAVFHSFFAERRPAGTFLVPNHLALWLSAVVLLLAGRALQGVRAERILALSLGLPALAGIVVAGSRGAVLGLAAGATWLLWVSRSRFSTRQRTAIVVAGSVMLLLLGAGLLVRMRGHDPFRYQRVKIWQASVAGLLEAPLWGTGPGQFEAVAARHRFPDGDGPLRFDRTHGATHSDWLRVPVEFGVPAALVLLATLGLATLDVARRRRLGELPSGSDGALAALIAIAVHAAVDNPSRWPAVYLLASVLWGALLARQSSRAAVAPGDRWRSPGRLALSAALVTAFLVADVAPYAAWRAVAGLPRGRLDAQGQARLERAVRLNRIHPDYRMRIAEHLAAGPPGLDAYAAAREAAEHAVRLDPRDARYVQGMARVDARACMEVFRTAACRDRVRDDYRRAAELSPYDAAIPLEQAMFLLDMGDPLGARRAAERALSLEPEAAFSRLVLAEALLENAPGDSGETARSVAELLREAEEKSERWAGRETGPYAERLLEIDAAHLEWLRGKVAEN